MDASSYEALDAPSAGNGKHIVDTLIEERASKLLASPFWPLCRTLLVPLLRKREAMRMADAIAPLPAREIFDFMSDLLRIDVAAEGLENVPRTGPVIVAGNHPTGIADGIAVYDALKGARADLAFFANRDAVRVAPRLTEMVIPVEWVVAKRSRARSRETLAATLAAFAQERCVVLFPSGRLAFRDRGGKLTEQPWLASVAVFARKYDCPVVPMHITARNSPLYYLFWKLNTELRDITLFNELLNKRGKPFAIRFGAPIAPSALPADPDEAAARLREHVTRDLPEGRPWRG